MYLWVVLATFLAALAAYVLPLRSDMTNIYDTPAAQAMLMQMVVKHKAAAEYMLRRTWPYYCEAGQKIDEDCLTSYKVDYIPSILSDNDVAEYLPFGFVNNANYTNVIRCVYNTGTEENPIFNEKSDCNDDDENNKVLRGLLTYGQIPERWIEFDENDQAFPSKDLEIAMRKHFGRYQMAGHLVKEGDECRNEAGKYCYVQNFEGRRFLIPASFYNQTFQNTCSSGACFVYLSWQ